MIHYRPKFLRNDPGFMILFMSLKMFIAMVLFVLIAHFFLHFNESVVIWSAFYVAFGAISCGFGSVSIRKKMFILYSLSFLIAILLAGLIHPYPHLLSISIVAGGFFIYWVRRFGAMYTFFPSLILIAYMISALQLPIEEQHYLQAIVSMVLSGGIFYLIVLKWLPWDVPSQLLKVTLNFLHDVYRQQRNMHCDRFSLSLNPQIVETQLLDQSHSFHDKASHWIISTKRKELWKSIWSDIDAIIRRMSVANNAIKQITQTHLYKHYRSTYTLCLLMLRNLAQHNDPTKHKHYCSLIQAHCEEISQLLIQQQCEAYIPDIELNACYDALTSFRRLPILFNFLHTYLRELTS